MENQSFPLISSDQEEKEKDFFKYWFKRLKKYTLLIVLCMLISIVAAFIYNKISIPVYQVTTSLVLKNKTNNLIEVKGLSNISDFENQSYLNNEVELLKSTYLIKRTLKKLDFNVVYYELHSFNKRNIYNTSPFYIVPFEKSYSSSTQLSKIKILNKFQFQFWDDINSKEAKIRHFGEKLVVNGQAFMVLLKPDKYYINKEYEFRFRNEQEIVNTFKNIKINFSSTSTVIKISCLGDNPDELSVFLNALCNEYLQKSIEKKSLISDKTLDFIESQLSEFSDSLKRSGLKLGGFKSTHQIMDIDQHSQQLFKNLEDLQKEKVALIGKLKYYEYLKDNVQNGQNDEKEIITPAIWGIDNTVLSKLINNLLEFANEKSELSYVTNKNNPLTKASDIKISDIKKQIVENANSLIDVTNISIKNVENQINELSNQASSLPKTQMELFNYERMFKIYDVLYTYLLTKRCELQMTKAALIPENEIIDEADPIYAQIVSPNVKNNILTAIFLGAAIPILLLFLFFYLSDKVRSLEDISELSVYPVLGNVIHDTSKMKIPVMEAPNTILAESFRSIRANFQFVSEKQKNVVVLLTSSLMGEGKSYVTVNMATSFALSGKKVIVLFFDLRKKLRNTPFKVNENNGLSNILSGNCTVSEAIQETGIANLSVILPGLLPPNPNELISSGYTRTMIEELNEKYDYVFIDTPPIGMFADALMLIPFVHINLLLVRYNYSSVSALKNIMATLYQKKIKNINLIVNDVPVKQSNYGYGYGYGFGYNHYHSEKRGFWLQLWTKIKQAV